MGRNTQELERDVVLDGERAIDRKCIDAGLLGELWERKRRLAFYYAKLFYYPWRRDGTDVLTGIGHAGFSAAVLAWDESRGSFNTVLKMSVRDAARRQWSFYKRGILNVPLGRAYREEGIIEDEIQAPTSEERLSFEFMDEVSGMPEDIQKIVLHCINNAHKYPHARARGLAKMGLRRGESSGLLLDVCGGSVWRARKAMTRIRAWLRGEREGLSS